MKKSFENSIIEVTNPIEEINSNIRSWLLFSETMKAEGHEITYLHWKRPPTRRLKVTKLSFLKEKWRRN